MDKMWKFAKRHRGKLIVVGVVIIIVTGRRAVIVVATTASSDAKLSGTQSPFATHISYLCTPTFFLLFFLFNGTAPLMRVADCVTTMGTFLLANSPLKGGGIE